MPVCAYLADEPAKTPIYGYHVYVFFRVYVQTKPQGEKAI